MMCRDRECNFITNDCLCFWPKWFREKYKNLIYFGGRGISGISSKKAASLDGAWQYLPADIQRVIGLDSTTTRKINLVFINQYNELHYINITAEKITTLCHIILSDN